MADFNKCMAEEFDSSKVYSLNDLVLYENKLYKCINQDYTAQEFSLENFEATYLTEVLGKGNIIDDNIAPLYDDTLTYSVGDYVMYNNALYKCNTEVGTAEEFDSEKWDKCYLSDFMKKEENTGLQFEQVTVKTVSIKIIDTGDTSAKASINGTTYLYSSNEMVNGLTIEYFTFKYNNGNWRVFVNKSALYYDITTNTTITSTDFIKGAEAGTEIITLPYSASATRCIRYLEFS